MNNQVRRVHIARDLITMLLSTGNTIPSANIVEGLPDDARITDARLLHDAGGIMAVELWIESEQFEPVPPGHSIPIIDIKVEQYRAAKEAE